MRPLWMMYFAAINSSLKSWIYSDLLLKPEEMVLFRPVQKGGLGLASVKLKSLACLIRNFIEIAADPSFINSQYETSIYNYYVLDIQSQQPPPRPPFYTEYFFQAIKDANESGLDVMKMKIKQWYNFLLKREYSDVIGDDLVVRPSRIELSDPSVLWDNIWKNVHLQILGNAEISFSWKLVHNLLTTEERVHATVGNTSASCKFFCTDDSPANLKHCLLSCDMSSDVGTWLIRIFQSISPASTVNDMLRLQIFENDALLWILVKSLFFCWCQRMARKRALKSECLSFLLADLMLLRETKYSTLVEKVDEILNL